MDTARQVVANIFRTAAMEVDQPQDLVRIVYWRWVQAGRPGGRAFWESEVLPVVYRCLPPTQYDSRSARVRLRDFSNLANLETVRNFLYTVSDILTKELKETTVVASAANHPPQENVMTSTSGGNNTKSGDQKQEFWAVIGEYFGDGNQPHDWQQQLKTMLRNYEASTMQDIKAQVSQLNLLITGAPIVQERSESRGSSAGSSGSTNS